MNKRFLKMMIQSCHNVGHKKHPISIQMGQAPIKRALAQLWKQALDLLSFLKEINNGT